MRSIRAVFVSVLLVAALTATGCGSDSSGNAEGPPAAEVQQAREQAQRRAARLRAEARREARVQARKARARRARRAALRQERAEQRQAEAEEEAAAAAEEESSECDPNYAGACLDPYASDYDCEGGSGDGPLYTGTVTVVGEDRHGLDANSNGVGCE